MRVLFDHLTKVFKNQKKGGKDVVAVNDFCFEIPDGKLVGLLGPSGCGKSTCLNLICGLEESTSGKIYFGEEDVTSLPPENRGVGMVFQNYALYPHLTVKENIIFPLENLKGKERLSKEEMSAKALEVSKLVQIEEYLDRKPSKLSGGQQQRVAIARALVKMPKVLLLDEPLSNLDARLRLQTREEIRRIQKETGITTVFVTHDQEEAMSICDTIVLMKDGVVQQIGKPQDVYDNPCNLFVSKFLGTPAVNVFDGYVKDHKVYIGDDYLFDKDIENKDVTVAIRPEGMEVNENGNLTCDFIRREVMGKDHSIVCQNKYCASNIRAIIPSDTLVDEDVDKIKFSLKPQKVYIFDKDNEKRL